MAIVRYVLICRDPLSIVVAGLNAVPQSSVKAVASRWTTALCDSGTVFPSVQPNIAFALCSRSHCELIIALVAIYE